MSSSTLPKITTQLVGGPTAVIEFAGLRFLTDPTFDDPAGPTAGLEPVEGKLNGPAVSFEGLESVDVVLISHDQHPDNLDNAGRALLPRVPLVITTTQAAGRLTATTVGLRPWEDHLLAGGVTVTAIPAQHGPEANSEAVSGPVIGFLLTSIDGQSVYVSGDNANVDIPRQVRERFGAPTVALLFGGGASVPFLFDGALLTMTNQELLESAIALGSGTIVPMHTEGWSHFTEDREGLTELFRRAGIPERLQLLTPGETAHTNE